MNEKEMLIGDKKIPLKAFIKKSYKYIKPVFWQVVLAFFLICINVAFDIILPLFVEKVIDSLKIAEGNIAEAGNILYVIAFIAVGYALMTVINQGFRLLEALILAKAGNRVVYNLRVEAFEHIEQMSLDQFEVMPVGSLVTRVCNYTKEMSDLYTNQILKLIRNIITIIGVFAIMVFMQPILSLLILGFALIVFIVSVFFRKRISKLSRKEKGLLSDLNTTLSEDLNGMKIIQLFNREETIKDRFYKKNKDFRDARFKIMMNFTFYRPFINFIQYAAIGVIFIAGVKFSISAGAIVAFYLYISKFFSPVQEISDQLVHIEKAVSSSERLYNLLDVQPKVVDKKNAINVEHFNGKIEFKHVWFSYDNKNWVLKDVNFVVEAGQSCAFVGATGAGKTTILSLLVKSYAPQKGQILIDGIDIADISISSLRKGIGQMLQDVFLFSGTIKDNVTLFDNEFSKKEIDEALNYVNADLFVDRLPKKIYTEVVERGENFSAGQRQLLSFARTILHKPQILLLDEATANIDTETEILIQDSLAKMKLLGTTLCVAHRLSTIKNSDQIICLQNGQIIERGTHSELMKKKGYYYKLSELQFKN